MVWFTKALLLYISLAVLACAPAPATVTPTAAPSRTPWPSPTHDPTPTTTPEPEDTGWRALAPGVEWRRLWADTAAGRERLHLIRFEPTETRLRVLYQPAHPRIVSDWARVLPDALVVVNAGYYTPQNQATGFIVSDGIARGRSYDDFAGMLAAGVDGQVTVRWLRTWPYNPDETLAQAVQSFPVLVKPGGVMGFPADGDEGKPSRRTVVAQDTAGRILLLVGPEFRFSLHELAVWLAESDLELDIALNLDGGTSTGLWVKGHEDNTDSLVPLPAVIAIESRDG